MTNPANPANAGNNDQKSWFRENAARAGNFAYTTLGAVTLKITKITGETDSLLNMVRSVSSCFIGIIETPVALLELQKIVPARILPYIPTLDVNYFAGLKPQKVFWGHLKDVLTPFEFISKVKTFTDGKTYRDATTLKKASMIAQLVQKTTEGLFLIPAKYNLLPYDLGKVCASIGTSIGGLTIFKELCVLVASSCNIVDASNKLNAAHSNLAKREEKLKHLAALEANKTKDGLVKYLNDAKQRVVVENTEKREKLHKKALGDGRTADVFAAMFVTRSTAQGNSSSTKKMAETMYAVLCDVDAAANIDKIIDHKRKKVDVRKHNENVNIGKLHAGRNFDISKVAIVTCGLISATGLTLLMGTQALAALTVTTYISGWIVAATGFYRTMYMAWWERDRLVAPAAFAG